MTLKRIVQRLLLLMRDVVRIMVPQQEVSILCYHGIDTHARIGDSGTTVSPHALEQQLAMLAGTGAAFVSLADVVAWQRGDRELPVRAVALTFDDGYLDFSANVIPILEKYRAPATVFVVGDAEAARAYLGDQLLSEHAVNALTERSLVTVGYHSLSHPNFLSLTSAEMEAQCAPRYGARFFAYPGGKYTSETVAILRRLGYEAACSIKPVLVVRGGDPYMLPRTVVMRDTPLWAVRAATTHASSWYRALTKLWRR